MAPVPWRMVVIALRDFDQTQQQIADRFGVTAVRIYQIGKKHCPDVMAERRKSTYERRSRHGREEATEKEEQETGAGSVGPPSD